MNWTVFSPNSYVEAFIPSTSEYDCIWRQVRPSGWALPQHDWCPYMRRGTWSTETRVCPHRAQTTRAHNKGSRVQAGKRILRTKPSWFWTSGLQNCVEIHFWCLSHPLCGILLQQSEQADYGRKGEEIIEQSLANKTDSSLNVVRNCTESCYRYWPC